MNIRIPKVKAPAVVEFGDILPNPVQLRVLAFLFFRRRTVLRLMREIIQKEYPDFEEVHKTQPLGSHVRIEFSLSSLEGDSKEWYTSIFWSPDDDAWAGMHIFIEWEGLAPKDMQTVY